jgi:F-type H+-transporting ATPase subunit gamma
MPSLKSIRTRIASVKSSQKITRAMKLVSAARLRRAQDAIVAARPYANALWAAVSEIAFRAGGEAHPLLQVRTGNRAALVVITSDRGLAGGLNANVFRAVTRFQLENPAAELSLLVVGKKGRDFYKRRKPGAKHEHPGVSGETAAERAKELARSVTQSFADGTVDTVHLVYNQFASAIQQRVVIEQIVPILPSASEVAAAAAGGAGAAGISPVDFTYEPDREALLSALIPLFVESQIYRACLESIASEFGARMTAMDNATNNARDIISSLTLQYNRARQAAITKELMEIVGGAEALKG